MASTVVLRRHISDITQCSICLDVLDTPKSLPCLHTFCLRCLQRTFATDWPGDVAACPICRQDFQLPAGGLAALPKNFTLDVLVELCTTTRPTSAPASLVVTPDVEPTVNEKSLEVVTQAEHIDETTSDVMLKVSENGIPAAETGNDGCSECSSPNEEHDPRSSAVSTEDVATSTTTACDRHADDAAEAEFCFDCRVDVCGACCCGDDHRRHRRRPSNEVTAECRRRVAGEMARVTDALNATYVALLDVDQRRADILDELRRKEDLARKECDSEDDGEVEERLRVLSAQKDTDLRLLADSKGHLDVDQTSLETFLKNGSRKLTIATTTATLLHLVKELKIEASSLLRDHQTRLNRSKVDGKQQTSLTEWPATLADEKPVCALTTMDDELYVARTGSHDIDVFDVQSFTLRRRLTITSVQRSLVAVVSFGRISFFSVTDMTSCRHYHCLYVAVADGRGGLVHRLDRRNGKQVTEWSIGGSSPAGLSVAASTSNVLVSCCDSIILRMYTPLGCPVCEISVQRPGMVGLVHGVQLDDGWFVVIGVTESGDRPVCVIQNNDDLPELIDSSGSAAYLASVGGPDGSYVWLAERGGASAAVRMLQVPASSCSAKLPAVKLEDPEKICWNENGQRLYIVEHGRLKIFHVHM